MVRLLDFAWPVRQKVWQLTAIQIPDGPATAQGPHDPAPNFEYSYQVLGTVPSRGSPIPGVLLIAITERLWRLNPVERRRRLGQ